MRRKRAADAGTDRRLFDDAPEILAGHGLAALGDKQIIAAAHFHQGRPGLSQVAVDPLGGGLSQRYQTLTPALARHTQHAMA